MLDLLRIFVTLEFWVGLVLGVFILDRAQFLGLVKWLWNHSIGLIPGVPKF